MRRTRIMKTKDSAGKLQEKRTNLPGGKTCMQCRKSLLVSMRPRKGGKATALKIVLEMLLKKVSSSTSKFRFILPNLHKMNWQDLVTFLHSKSFGKQRIHILFISIFYYLADSEPSRTMKYQCEIRIFTKS